MRVPLCVPESTKKWLSVSGLTLALLGLVFVITRISRYGSQVALPRLGSGTLFLLFALAIAYGIVSLLLASAWCDLLQHFDVKVDTFWAIRVHGLTQLAKYVPGNIFHLAGRQAMGVSAGFPTWPLAKSIALEILMMAGAGSHFILLALPSFSVKISGVQAMFIFLLSLLLTLYVLNRFLGPLLARAFFKYIVFLGFSGLLFVLVACTVLSSWFTFPIVLRIIGVFLLAWFLGLVTPGAPAGAGVRELVLLKLLSPVLGEADLLTAIVFGRIVTVVGDVVYYVIAASIWREAIRRTKQTL